MSLQRALGNNALKELVGVWKCEANKDKRCEHLDDLFATGHDFKNIQELARLDWLVYTRIVVGQETSSRNKIDFYARSSTKLGVDFLVEHFQTTFPRAKAFQVNILPPKFGFN